MGLNQVWIAIFALVLSVRQPLPSGASLWLMEFSLHISVFELHLSLGPLYSKGTAQTCQDMMPHNAGR